jgi:hypothetical protein
MDLRTYSYEISNGWGELPPSTLDSRTTLVLAFGASSLLDQPQSLKDLRAAFPRSLILGCSTSGEIHGTRILDESLSVAVMRFSSTRLGYAQSAIEGATDSRAAGESIGRSLAQPDLRAVLVLSDGLKVNGTELVSGLNAALPEDVVVTGGLAGDGDRFKRTWVLAEGGPASGFVTAVGFYGDTIRVGHGSKGGWDIFGPERLVTRSEGNVLYELDGRPALELYKTYLGERASGLPATGLLFPLSLRSNDDRDEKRLVRTILAVDESTQSLTFAGDIPTGSRAQLMRANFDRLVEGAAKAAAMTRVGDGGDGPTLSVAISCVGRRLVLGERTEEEIEATAEALPAGASQVGFYSYGELSPFATGRCDLHNQTMTLTTFSEE